MLPRPDCDRLANIIVGELGAPDLLAVQEIAASSTQQDIVPATATYHAVCEAVIAAGGPLYDFREIPPLKNQDGGQEGYNIRVGFLFNPQSLAFSDCGNAGPKDATGIRRAVDGGISLTFNPGRIAPEHPAFAGDGNCHWAPSRKALIGEFQARSGRLFIIVCHLKSMRSSSRREAAYGKQQRHAQARIIHDFAANILACDPQSYVVILGDMNDIPSSKTLSILKGGLFSNLLEGIPRGQRYTCRHGARMQALDHILVSHRLAPQARVCIHHINSDCPDVEQVSDHDPVLAVFQSSPAYYPTA